MRKLNSFLTVIMLACAFLCFVPAYSAYAFELPDTSKPASLTMVLKSSDDGGKVAAGAEITCYLVAELKTSNGIVSYELTDGYDKCGLDLDNKISQSQIDDLMDHTLENKLTGISAKSDKDGKVVFSSMKQGVYLIAASDLPEGFTAQLAEEPSAVKVTVSGAIDAISGLKAEDLTYYVSLTAVKEAGEFSFPIYSRTTSGEVLAVVTDPAQLTVLIEAQEQEPDEE